MNANDRVAIVTGAGSGIGRRVSIALLNEGYSVAIAGRRQSALEETVAEAGEAGARALAKPTDVADPASVSALFEACRERFGRGHVNLQVGGDRRTSQEPRGEEAAPPVAEV